jgi:hypothetical protein
MQLILYSKPGCHLCEGVAEKLQQVQGISIEVEVRDITTDDGWFRAYEYEIPVLLLLTPAGEQILPRLSPRTTVQQWEKQLLAWTRQYSQSV